MANPHNEPKRKDWRDNYLQQAIDLSKSHWAGQYQAVFTVRTGKMTYYPTSGRWMLDGNDGRKLTEGTAIDHDEFILELKRNA